MLRLISAAINDLDQIICRSNFRGYDPYDVLNNRLLVWLALRSRLTGVALTQAFRFFPLNLRPVLGIPRLPNAKTMALLVRAYLKLYANSNTDCYRERARFCLNWLDTHRSTGFANACWGYSFPWCTIRQFLTLDAPSVVCTSFVGQAFLDAYEMWGDEHHLAVARSACDFILNDCPRTVKGQTYCFNYTPFGELPVHNANLLGVSLLGRVYRYTGEQPLLSAALQALRYTLDDQNENGSWYYHGPYSRRDGTIDNFHTGFVLECLRRFRSDINSKGTCSDVSRAIERGQAFYEKCLFESDGTPWRRVGRQYPLDIRDSAEFLVVMGQMEMLNPPQKFLLTNVLQWTFRTMRDRSGYFYFLRWRNWGYSPMYLRWQAWMLWALANVLPSYQDRTA